MPKKIDKVMEQTIIDTRKCLEKQLYSQIGALAISYDLRHQGITSPPMSTINKILKRNELVRKRPKYPPKGVDYPTLEIIQSNYLY